MESVVILSAVCIYFKIWYSKIIQKLQQNRRIQEVLILLLTCVNIFYICFLCLFLFVYSKIYIILEWHAGNYTTVGIYEHIPFDFVFFVWAIQPMIRRFLNVSFHFVKGFQDVQWAIGIATYCKQITDVITRHTNSILKKAYVCTNMQDL